uniref:Uncharacterized protein n=1 Tax=Alexandrium monilatum TaxID=311494 RepID=A0A7S4S378_9DINO
MQQLFWLHSARVLAVLALGTEAAAGQESTANCSLEALWVWGGGSPLQLDPAFSPAVHHYKASLDYAAEPVWVDPVARGAGCEARRADPGRSVVAGGRGEVAVVVRGEDHASYSVALTRRSGRDDALDSLALRGAEISPTFRPEVHSYRAQLLSSVRGGRERAVLIVAPADMGQGLEVSLRGGGVRASAAELPQSLEFLRWRRRNFTLGRWSSGGRLQLPPPAARSWRLPLDLDVRVWPAAAAARPGGGPEGPPARTYTVRIYPAGEGPDDAESMGTHPALSLKGVVAAAAAVFLCCVLLGIVYVNTMSTSTGEAEDSRQKPLEVRGDRGG